MTCRGKGQLLGEVRVDVPGLVNVIEDLRFVLVRAMIACGVSGDGLSVDAHAPVLRLRTSDIICAQISHRLLDRVVRIAIVQTQTSPRHLTCHSLKRLL